MAWVTSPDSGRRTFGMLHFREKKEASMFADSAFRAKWSAWLTGTLQAAGQWRERSKNYDAKRRAGVG